MCSEKIKLIKKIMPKKLKRRIISKCGFFPKIKVSHVDSCYIFAEQTIYIDVENPFVEEVIYSFFHELAHFLYRNMSPLYDPKAKWYEYEEMMANNFAHGMMKKYYHL